MKAIPLGGVEEFGKNLWIFEINKEMVIIDTGLKLPDNTLPGIDKVIPDFTYLKENREKIKGLILTQGHQEQIGGVPYLLKELELPVYGSELTLAFLENELENMDLKRRNDLNRVQSETKVNLGSIVVEFIEISYSFPQTYILAVYTPLGIIVFAPNFRLDQTPLSGKLVNYSKLTEYNKGYPGTLALFADSKGVEKKEYSVSEKTVKKNLTQVIEKKNNRIIITINTDNFYLLQQILNIVSSMDRKILIPQKKVKEKINIAQKKGFFNFPEKVLLNIEEKNSSKLLAEKNVILTMEPKLDFSSYLNKIVEGNTSYLEITENDTVIIAESLTVENKKITGDIINKIMEKGAEVLLKNITYCHAGPEELKLMLNLIKPEFFVPVHGEQRYLNQNARLATEAGISLENILIPQLGEIIELSGSEIKSKEKIELNDTLVDGLGVGDVGRIILKDREILANEGLIVVVVTINGQGKIIAGPKIITRGFKFKTFSQTEFKEQEIEMSKEIEFKINKALKKCESENITDWSVLKKKIKNAIDDYIYEIQRKKPMILPVITQI